MSEPAEEAAPKSARPISGTGTFDEFASLKAVVLRQAAELDELREAAARDAKNAGRRPLVRLIVGLVALAVAVWLIAALLTEGPS